MAAASDRVKRGKRFVLDCSVVLGWCFADEQTPYSIAVLDSFDTREAVVPALWIYEIANAFVSGERRKRSATEDTAMWLQLLRQLPIVLDEMPAQRLWDDLVHLARLHNLSAYDAAYLELATRLSLPLATLDGPLKRAAKAAGVTAFLP